MELVARDPGMFAGAIAICPGFDKKPNYLEVKIKPDISKRAFAVISGAQQHPDNIMLAKKDVEWLRTAGALVIYQEYEDMGHDFPPDYFFNLLYNSQFIFTVREWMN